MTRSLWPILGLLAAVFAGLIVLTLATGNDAGDAAVAPVAASRPAAAAQAAVPDLTAAWVATILGRPLFEPGRRPEAVATAAGAVAQGLPRLTGVLVSPAGKSVIFAAPAGGKPIISAEGDRVGRFVVQSIAAGEVTLVGPDGPRVLHPSFDPVAPPPSRPAPRPAPPVRPGAPPRLPVPMPPVAAPRS